MSARLSKVARSRVSKAELVHYAALSEQALKNCWRTPGALWDALHAEFDFTLDGAADRFNHKLKRYNSASHPDKYSWLGGQRVFINPPYKDRKKPIVWWVRRAYEASLDGSTVVLVLPAQMNAGWIHRWAARGQIRIPPQRIAFDPPPGLKGEHPRHDSLGVVLGPDFRGDRFRPDVVMTDVHLQIAA